MMYFSLLRETIQNAKKEIPQSADTDKEKQNLDSATKISKEIKLENKIN